MEAALSSVELPGASLKDTLTSLENGNRLDEDRVLPNGMVFNKTVVRNNVGVAAGDTRSVNSGGKNNNLVTPVKGSNGNTSKPINNTNGKVSSGMKADTKAASPTAAAAGVSPGSARQVVNSAWANITTSSSDAFAERQRMEKRGPLPSVPVKRIEDLHDEDPLKVLHEGRQRKAKELKRMEDDLKRIKRNLNK